MCHQYVIVKSITIEWVLDLVGNLKITHNVQKHSFQPNYDPHFIGTHY